MWDHLIQDYDSTKDNFGSVREHPERFDINFCPAGGERGHFSTSLLLPLHCTDLLSTEELAVINVVFLLLSGKAGCRDQTLLRPENMAKAASSSSHSPPGQTGERDWLHANSVSYDPVRDQVAVSLNVPGEIVIVDHGTTPVRDDN